VGNIEIDSLAKELSKLKEITGGVIASDGAMASCYISKVKDRKHWVHDKNRSGSWNKNDDNQGFILYKDNEEGEALFDENVMVRSTTPDPNGKTHTAVPNQNNIFVTTSATLEKLK
jgi:hypothetical protein